MDKCKILIGERLYEIHEEDYKALVALERRAELSGSSDDKVIFNNFLKEIEDYKSCLGVISRFIYR